MKYCPTCGKVVPRGHGYKKNQKYCSYRCYQSMTPKMIEIQEELGQPIREVIVETPVSYTHLDVYKRQVIR